MSITRPILVATDLSARSDRAVDRAFYLAKRSNVPLLVCHVVESGSRLEGDADLAVAAVRSVLPDPMADVEILVCDGSAPEVLLEQAIEHDCGLIVTGVARYNHPGDFFIGTAVDRIVREAASPVLVVKQRSRTDYRTILAATDFSTCSRHALLTAARLFPSADIHLVHAFHVPFEGFLSVDQNLEEFRSQAQEEFDAFLRDAAIAAEVRERISPHLRYGETQGVVQQLVHEVRTDLVVLGTHGRSGISKAFFGSMAEALLRCVQSDTMVVREPA